MGFRATKRKEREDAENESGARGATESALADWLLHQLSWGLLSASQCQKIAQLSEDDMNAQGCTCNQSLSRIANLGSRGRHVNNIWRDAQALFGNVKVIHPKTHCLPLKNGKTVRSSASPSFWPHQLFSCLYHHYPQAWSNHICPSQRRQLSFWTTVAETDLFKNHPLSRDRRGVTNCNLFQDMCGFLRVLRVLRVYRVLRVSCVSTSCEQ